VRAASSAGPLVLGRVRDFTVACSCSLPLSSDWRAATRAGSVPCADGSRKSTVEHRHNTLADLKLIYTVKPDTKKTVLSVSRPLRWCELDSRQLKTVADRKFEV